MFKRLHQVDKSPSKAYLQSYTERQKTLTSRNHNKPKPRVTSTYSQQHQYRRNTQPINYDIISTPEYLYQGKWNRGQKSGEGVLFTRKGMLIIGNWRRNYLEGRAIIHTAFGGVASVQFRDGKLNGWSVVNYRNKVLVCTLYFDDKIDGQRITFDEKEELWVASKYSKDGKEFKQISHVQKGTRSKLPSFVRQPDLLALLQQFLTDQTFSLIEFQRISLIKISTSVTYLGYLDENAQKPKGLGVVFSNAESFSGNFLDAVLDVYGRMIYPNGDIYQGDIKSGTFEGMGYFYQPENNLTIVGQSANNEFINIVEENKGYVAFDVEPLLGRQFGMDPCGFRGKSLNDLSQLVEKYYFCYSVNIRKAQSKELSVARQNSQEDCEDFSNKGAPPKSKTPIIGPIKSRPNIWIDNEFQGQSESENQENSGLNIQLHKVYSMPKAQRDRNNNFESLVLKENYDHKQMQKYNKRLPQQNDKKLGATLGKVKVDDKGAKSMDAGQLTFRNIEPKKVSGIYDNSYYKQANTLNVNKLSNFQLQRFSLEQKSNLSEIQSKSGSNMSQTSNRLDSMLKRAKSKRKRIFQ